MPIGMPDLQWYPLFVTFSRQPTFTRLILEISIFIIKKNQNCRSLNETLSISGNIESTKKADHILELPRLKEFIDY